MSIESFEIKSELFPGENGLPRRYDLINSKQTMGLTVLAEDGDAGTALRCGAIYEGHGLSIDPDGAIADENASVSSPCQLRERGAPIVFYGPTPDSTIAVNISPPLTDPEKRRKVVAAFALYAATLTQITTEFERACPPFGVTRVSDLA